VITRGLLLCVLVGCEAEIPPDRSVEQPGEHAVGTRRLDLGRTVQVWYPTTSTMADVAIETLEIDPLRTRYATLLAGVTTPCPSRRLEVALDGDPEPGPFPLVLASHCHSCTRFSAFSIAEHLASHGFVVAAPDHTGNTLFDELAGNSAAIGEQFLLVRRADLGVVIDKLLAGSIEVTEQLRGQIDATRVGAIGHSFGAATVGRLAQEDPRVRATVAIATPIENPFFPGNKIADIHVPLLSILAEEDNSIGAIGNNLIASNFKIANPPIRLVRVRDAGHWNFTDICGLIDGFSPGCGEGVRQTVPGEAFTYLDIEVGRGIARAYAVAFFDRYLRDAPAAQAYLDAPDPAGVVTVETRE